MKRIVAVVIFVSAFAFSGSAQDFGSAVGIRLGYPLSVTYKTFINETSAIEGYAGIRSFFNYTQVSINAAYLIHKDIPSVDHLQWYYGGGASINFASFEGQGGSSSTYLGGHGYIGLSYTFEDIPLNLSIDWIPSFYLGSNNGFSGGYGSLAGRYILNK